MTCPERPAGLRRRQFLQLTAGGALSLGLVQLRGPGSDAYANAPPDRAEATYDSWQDVYREIWQWDSVTWGSHTNQCAPGGCSFRVYGKGGLVWRVEQTGASAASSPDYPDYNPQGCQKGCGFHHALYGAERVLYPMERAGERGEGRWRRVSWDHALTRIADAILDAHQTHGPESFVIDAPHIHAGSVALA